jgi:HlyD family secretion protein
VGAGAGYAYWQHAHQGELPIGIAYGNGRIEADQIDIDTKFAGRIAEMFVDEGDMVKAGQVLARMDTQDLAAELKRSEAQIQEAQHSLDEAHANVDLTKTQVTLTQQEFERAGEARLRHQRAPGPAPAGAERLDRVTQGR